MKTYFVYMMSNASRVVLYTGVTNDLARRVWEHQHGEVRGFTRDYRTTKLVYYEDFPDPLSAICREKEIKRWRRSKKDALVNSSNRHWRDLSPELFQHLRGSLPASRLEMTSA